MFATEQDFFNLFHDFNVGIVHADKYLVTVTEYFSRCMLPISNMCVHSLHPATIAVKYKKVAMFKISLVKTCTHFNFSYKKGIVHRHSSTDNSKIIKKITQRK